MAQLCAMICRPAPETYYGQIAALLARPDFRPLLPKIACPTLVLCGDDDKLSSAESHKEAAQAIPSARLVVVEACGHMAPMERPEAVTVALRDWIG
jgi:pimeloyl-ACP methyl ester carboxylesterase